MIIINNTVQLSSSISRLIIIISEFLKDDDNDLTETHQSYLTEILYSNRILQKLYSYI